MARQERGVKGEEEADSVFVSGASALEAGLAFDTPHALDASLFPSDHLGVMAKLTVGAR